MEPRHIILAGDSIFDNDVYVPGEPGLTEQLRRALPPDWSCTKRAVDGDCITHVAGQLRDLPSHSTDLVISVGGNDARSHSNLLTHITAPEDLPRLLGPPLDAFRAAYREMLRSVLRKKLMVTVSTIYTQIPFEDPVWRRYAPLAIEGFNAVILEEAAAEGIPVLRIDEICRDPADFSELSPIEPSAQGAQKIVDLILAELSKRP